MGVADVNRAGTGVSMGAVWGDYDNDGYEDLFLYKYGRPELFHNEQGHGVRPGRRARRAAALGERQHAPCGSTSTATAGSTCSSPAIGRRTSTSGTCRRRGSCRRASSTRRTAAGSTCLRNRGDGTFEDVVGSAGHHSPPLDARRGRRRPVRHRLSRSVPRRTTTASRSSSPIAAGERFEEVGRETGVGRTPKSGMNASFGDVFNDGRLSIYKTNISEPGVLVQGNDLWVPKNRRVWRPRVREPGRVAGRRPRRLELGRAVRRSEQRRHAGSLPGQRLHLGGRADELLVRLRSDCRRPQPPSSATPRNWPAMNGRSLSGYQRKRVWLNDGFGPIHRGGAGGRRHRYVRRPRGRAGRPVQSRARSMSSSRTSGARCCLREHGGAGPTLDRTSSWRERRATAARSARASSCDWDGRDAGSGGQRRQRIQRPEPTAPALRARFPDGGRAGRYSLAVRSAADPGPSSCRRVAPREGASVRTLDNRLLPPLLITGILDRRALVVWNSRELSEYRCRDRDSHRRGDGPGAHHLP